MFHKIFSRRHIWKTVLIGGLILLFLRLGVWQLSRLQERKAANEVLAAQLAQSSFSINDEVDSVEWEPLLDRGASAIGTYDFENQMVLVQQRHNGQFGVHLVTPLLLDGSDKAVLVDRGWVPSAESEPGVIAQFDEMGTVEVVGFVQNTERLPRTARTDPNPTLFEREIFQINTPRLQEKLPYDLLPVFLLQTPDPDQTTFDIPFRSEPEIDLSDGPHLGYALQWFAFAIIAVIFYTAYLHRFG
jgi:surfeit locus 1 family protein